MKFLHKVKIIFLVLLYFIVYYRFSAFFQRRRKVYCRRVCVIGAGSAGLVAARNLKLNNLDVTVYEATQNVGGMWNVPKSKENNLRYYSSPGYLSLSTNTGSAVTHFKDYPLTNNSEDEVNIQHETVLKYLKDYAHSNNLLGSIKFGHVVENIKKIDSKWEVKVFNGATTSSSSFDAVVVCTGAFWKPHLPLMAGLSNFKKPVLHSSEYLEPSPFVNKKVMVVGLGTSAADIATEISTKTPKAYIYAKRGRALFINNRPTYEGAFSLKTSLKLFVHSFLPWKNRSTPYTEVAIPNLPPVDKLATVVRQGFADAIKQQKIKVLSGNIEFTSDGVIVKDEKIVLDAVIMATGYQEHTPFVPTNFDTSGRYMNTFCVADPTLAFINFKKTLSHFFVSEIQAMWISSFLSGKIGLPSKLSKTKDVAIVRNIEFGEYVSQELGLGLKYNWAWLNKFFFSQYTIDRFGQDLP